MYKSGPPGWQNIFHQAPQLISGNGVESFPPYGAALPFRGRTGTRSFPAGRRTFSAYCVSTAAATRLLAGRQSSAICASFCLSAA